MGGEYGVDGIQLGRRDARGTQPQRGAGSDRRKSYVREAQGPRPDSSQNLTAVPASGTVGTAVGTGVGTGSAVTAVRPDGPAGMDWQGWPGCTGSGSLAREPVIGYWQY
eukprot:1222107-Rhodomonas_salina.1